MKKIYGYITVKKMFEIDNPLLEEVIDDLTNTEYEFSRLLDNYSDEIGDTEFEKFVTEQYELKTELEEELLSKEIFKQLDLKDDEQVYEFMIEDINGHTLMQKN